MAGNSAFVVPWAKNFHLFTEFNLFHRNDVISDYRMLEQHVLPALPGFIVEEIKAPYTRLIRSIVNSSSLRQSTSKNNNRQRFVVPFGTDGLAARQDGKLCAVSEIFDHNDTVFSAAFRFEATDKFLMAEAQTDSSLWHDLGLRHRDCGRFKGNDYLACLGALERRLAGNHDQELTNDTETVLYPLCAGDGSLSDLDVTTWSIIASLSILPVRPVSEYEPGYRKECMESFASLNSRLNIKHVVRHEFAAVCWSQTPFVLHEPSISSLQKIGWEGKPSCAKVWQHLKVLSEVVQHIDESDLEEFMDDLQRTYEFLQLNLQESKITFIDPRAAIWLNIEETVSTMTSLDCLRSSWISLENLLLDSPCDTPPLMTVQSFLGRFSTLLKAVGCKSLYYPPITSPASSTLGDPFAHVQELWKEEALTDVIFEAEGNKISAHKVMLASRSMYCKRQFHGPWASTAVRKETSTVIKLEDMSYATLKILIAFCYNVIENRDWRVDMQVKADDPPRVRADKLDSLLDILVAADRWFMPDLHAEAEQQILTGIRFFVQPDNVKGVEKVAGQANAAVLQRYCQEYRLRNAAAVLLTSVADD